MTHAHVDKYRSLRQEFPRLGGSHYYEICACGSVRRCAYRHPVEPWHR